MVKITDVAAMAGVAKSTVSNVLTGKKYVSEELREKVLAACKELDFEPNFYASGLSSKKTNIIALLLEVTSDIADYPFYKDLILSCLQEAAVNGYSLLVYYEKDEAKLLKILRQGRAPIDGAILLTPDINDGRLAEMESRCAHCVTIGRSSCEDINYIDIDNKGLVREVVQKLAGDYGGDIYLINAKKTLTISQDRTEGFKEGCAICGIDVEGRIYESRASSETDGFNIAKNLIKKNSVFITANESVAMGCYKAAENAGLKVGGDVAVFSLGRSVTHGRFTPKLSYAFQDYSALGKRAVDMLVNEMNGRAVPSELLVSKLNFNESTIRQ